jgi:hypothetical protein
MRPKPFADLLKQWVADAGHPGVAEVRTCAEVGRHEQPMGVQITLTDGWAFVLQLVRTSPDGGDRQGEGLDGLGWDREAYQSARVAADEAAAGVKPPARVGRPQAKTSDLLSLVLDAVKRADHPAVSAVEVARVSCADGSTIFGLPVGFIPPGAASFGHPAHEIPKEYR